MADRIPNLFLVGAMRSGTTALHEVLGSHPDVFMSQVKEPAFFADPAELALDSRVAAAAGYAGDRAAYLGLFAGAGNAMYAGESSTHYTKRPRINGAAGRIAETAPNSRILYLVRDPVRRTLSHYRYHVRAKYERLPCLQALRTEPVYCATSDYAMQIEPFFEAFGRDAVHIVVLEELTRDPTGELQRIYDWLGIPATGGRTELPQRNEVTGDIARARGPAALHSIGRSSSYQRIARALVPQRVRRRVRSLLNEPIVAEDIDTPEVLDYLRAVHGPQVDRFEPIVGRPMELWTTTRHGRTTG